WCRSRPDWLTNDSRLLIDYKTTSTSAEPDTWARGPMLAMGYDVQAAFGLRGIKAIRQPHDCSFVFMVQETESPFAVSFVGATRAAAAAGRHRQDRAHRHRSGTRAPLRRPLHVRSLRPEAAVCAGGLR